MPARVFFAPMFPITGGNALVTGKPRGENRESPPWERNIEDIFSLRPRIESADSAMSGSLARAQKKSSLQGLVGEVLTICRRGWLACWKLAWSQCSGPRLRHLSVCDGPCLIGVWLVSAPSEPTGTSRHGQTSSSCPRAATRLIGLEHRDFAVES